MKLTCKADGAPTPTLSWKNPSGKVIKEVIDLKNIKDVLMSSDQDFGIYTCEATNVVHTDTSTVLVRQISKWKITCRLVVNWWTWKKNTSLESMKADALGQKDTVIIFLN